ncbi:MAG: ABC transporter ATP-binding protein [Verrucomicrobia bacterium]|nr:ABC transporter ATP-binding protein [Verrucomicrobiota bacterium]MBM3871081.1 ABC transporter ATP-binding protein [Verrucomicrobiota bacterium]
MSEPLLRATGLRKTYRIGVRLVEVLRGVDFAVQAGEFVALRGASGAGKSTLLHLLGGLDRPNHGDIQFRAQSLAALTDGELAKLRIASIGHVFQAYHLLPELDALENVSLPARVARLDAAEAERRARELLRRVGLEQRLEHRPAELSGGEQQRVAIARALVNQPQLILADEPTGNLDSHTGEEILNLLCELRTEHNATLVIATHDARVAARAPRVVELLDGALK